MLATNDQILFTLNWFKNRHDNAGQDAYNTHCKSVEYKLYSSLEKKYQVNLPSAFNWADLKKL